VTHPAAGRRARGATRKASAPDLTPIELLERLVAFDTTSRNCNLELIAFIENYLANLGVTSRRYDHVPGCKTNLLATVGPADVSGVVLSGHTDTVPVEDQPWTSDPFCLTARGTRLYGRGACDMKGFIAVALASIPELLRRRLRTPLHLALSCDEEIGCLGVGAMIAGMNSWLPVPRLVVVGEPSSMRVLDGHKGTMTFVTEVTGAEAHSSDPSQGVNAISYAARLLAELEASARELRAVMDPGGRFDPPYTTLNVGMITGGTAKNIVPGRCRITWEMRPLPGADVNHVSENLRSVARALETEMQAVAPRASIETRLLYTVPALQPAASARAKAFLTQLVGSAPVAAASFTTEAGHFQAAGMPALICGPGAIAQAHKPDEFIERAELERCAEFIRRLGRACETELPL
jgi:acetylornithine deacetylase